MHHPADSEATDYIDRMKEHLDEDGVVELMRDLEREEMHFEETVNSPILRLVYLRGIAQGWNLATRANDRGGRYLITQEHARCIREALEADDMREVAKIISSYTKREDE